MFYVRLTRITYLDRWFLLSSPFATMKYVIIQILFVNVACTIFLFHLERKVKTDKVNRKQARRFPGGSGGARPPKDMH